MINDLDSLLETFPCDLCGQENEEFLYTKRGVLTNYPFRVVRCQSCGLMYLNPRLGEQAIAELYDRNYYDGKGFDSRVRYIADFGKESDTEKSVRREEALKIIKEIVPPPAVLLDFGCGLGDFMRRAIKHGYKARGFDVSHFAAEFARASALEVYDSLDQLPHEECDIVTANEVLEHCSSPMKALAAIYRCLKPGGTFYYTTANFDGFYRRWRLGIKDSLDGYVVPEGHIHFFSTQVMKSYFRKTGFSKVFYYESRAYQKNGRVFGLFSRLGLAETGDAPNTFLGRLSYYGARKVATVLRLRKTPLPLARK